MSSCDAVGADVQPLEQVEEASCGANARDAEIGDQRGCGPRARRRRRSQPVIVRGVSTTVCRNCEREEAQRELHLVVPTVSASSICCGAGQTEMPLA
jgi:hypothetical protein